MNTTLSNLAEKLGAPQIQSSGEVRFNCPFCVGRAQKKDHKHKLWVNMRKNATHCFRCGYKSSVTRLCANISVPPPDALDMVGPKIKLKTSVELPKGLSMWHTRQHGKFPQEKKYAVKRGMNNHNCGYFGFMPGTVVIVNSIRHITHYWERDIHSKEFNVPRNTLKPLYFLDTAITARILVIAEGPFDALAWWKGSIRCGVALIGKVLTDYQAEQLKKALPLSQIQEIVVALDADVSRTEILNLVSRLAPFGRPISFISLPDGYDSDELTIAERDEVFAMRQSAKLSTLLVK